MATMAGQGLWCRARMYNYGLEQLDFFLFPQVPRQELVMQSSLQHEPQACPVNGGVFW